MSCLQYALYVSAAIAELIGVVIAGYDVLRSHQVLKEYTDPNAPNQNAAAFGVHPLNKMALTHLLSGRLRRMASVVLLSAGVILGLFGNLAG